MQDMKSFSYVVFSFFSSALLCITGEMELNATINCNLNERCSTLAKYLGLSSLVKSLIIMYYCETEQKIAINLLQFSGAFHWTDEITLCFLLYIYL